MTKFCKSFFFFFFKRHLTLLVLG